VAYGAGGAAAGSGWGQQASPSAFVRNGMLGVSIFVIAFLLHICHIHCILIAYLLHVYCISYIKSAFCCIFCTCSMHISHNFCIFSTKLWCQVTLIVLEQACNQIQLLARCSCPYASSLTTRVAKLAGATRADAVGREASPSHCNQPARSWSRAPSMCQIRHQINRGWIKSHQNPTKPI
jgi:hypothetical protein